MYLYHLQNPLKKYCMYAFFPSPNIIIITAHAVTVFQIQFERIHAVHKIYNNAA